LRESIAQLSILSNRANMKKHPEHVDSNPEATQF
jgi:hypothetical protein